MEITLSRINSRLVCRKRKMTCEFKDLTSENPIQKILKTHREKRFKRMNAGFMSYGKILSYTNLNQIKFGMAVIMV